MAHRDSKQDAQAVSERRAAHRAQQRENDWSHPRRMDGLNVLDELQACADPYCRYCKDQDGEVRDGFAV